MDPRPWSSSSPLDQSKLLALSWRSSARSLWTGLLAESVLLWGSTSTMSKWSARVVVVVVDVVVVVVVVVVDVVVEDVVVVGWTAGAQVWDRLKDGIVPTHQAHFTEDVRVAAHQDIVRGGREVGVGVAGRTEHGQRLRSGGGERDPERLEDVSWARATLELEHTLGQDEVPAHLARPRRIWVRIVALLTELAANGPLVRGVQRHIRRSWNFDVARRHLAGSAWAAAGGQHEGDDGRAGHPNEAMTHPCDASSRATPPARILAGRRGSINGQRRMISGSEQIVGECSFRSAAEPA